MIRILFIALLFALTFSCSATDEKEIEVDVENTPASLELTEATAPFNIGSASSFYKDIVYGEYERNLFDFFAPTSTAPAALLIYIHGGGFTGGQKSVNYQDPGFQNLVTELLDENVAIASLNYRYIGPIDGIGVLNSLNDSKRALQFIRYHAEALNIKKENVVLMGSSAGAGTSLWIGLNDDMALPESDDPILRESTRVSGIVAVSTQASYDVVEWPTTVFSEYQSEGMDFETLIDLVGEETLFQFYGIAEIADVYTAPIEEHRAELDMFALMSADDPELLVSNASVAYEFPADRSATLHHPLHAKALKDRADAINLANRAYIPQLGIDTTEDENIVSFVLRKVGN